MMNLIIESLIRNSSPEAVARAFVEVENRMIDLKNLADRENREDSSKISQLNLQIEEMKAKISRLESYNEAREEILNKISEALGVDKNYNWNSLPILAAMLKRELNEADRMIDSLSAPEIEN